MNTLKLPKHYRYVHPLENLLHGDMMPNSPYTPDCFMLIPKNWENTNASFSFYFIRKISGNSAGLKKTSHVNQKS